MVDWRCSFLSLNEEDSTSCVFILSKSGSNCLLPSLCTIIFNLHMLWRLTRIFEIFDTILNFFHECVCFLLKLFREENNPFVELWTPEEGSDCSIKICLFAELNCLLISNQYFSWVKLGTLNFKRVCIQSHFPFCH